MAPTYMNENRYSYLVGSWRRPASDVYAPENPAGAFEQHLQDLYLKGQGYLQHEEYTLALNAFQEAMAVILRTVHPSMPIDPNQIRPFRFPFDITMVDTLTAKAADILRQTEPARYVFPPSVISDQSALSAQAQQLLMPALDSGLQIKSFHAGVEANVHAALEAADRQEWQQAVTLYRTALDQTPVDEGAIRGSLLHDLAVLSEKAGDRGHAQEFGQASINTFAGTKLVDAQALVLATTVGIFTRSGDTQYAADLTKQLDHIRDTTILNPVVPPPRFVPGGDRVLSEALVNPSIGLSTRIGPRIRVGRQMDNLLGGTLANVAGAVAEVATAAAPTFTLDPGAPQLMGLKYVVEARPRKALTIHGQAGAATIALDGAGGAPVANFLQTLAATTDIDLLTNWLVPVHFVAYIPQMYFYVLPMSIGDCYAGMGNLDDARQSYTDVLPYPFINKNYEIVKIWTRLAQTFLDLGDQAYRNARDNAGMYGVAKALYENIVRVDKTIPADSPLYVDTRFSAIKARITAFLNAPNPVAVNDNPALLTIVLNALGKLQQIQAGLNFFGFGPDYMPPFSFEYLQNTARYFAQQASQTEQRYIQYKSQAENEEFRRDQLAQQAEIARQSVVLEQRGLVEAQRGVQVANASLNYANQQLAGAVGARTDFANVRWELLELSEAEAWASAASVDRDDEVKLTWTGSYYNSNRKRRSLVLQGLAYQRTRLSHDLEANRLQRAVDSARAYQGVAQAQIAQAQARVAVAQQRVAVAQLQQRYSEENRDFLDMREFGARLWYELAQQMRRLMQRYLDMATEIAFLMERAYNAETERGLRVIRFDYQHTTSGNLMGADMLLADVDSFTYDLVTTTKARKIPVKKTISLADAHPMQFLALKSQGRCLFETQLEDFDRDHPGLYLAKVRNVELVFVGITGATSIAGTLRNVGVSRFRKSDGSVIERLYPADVMALSQYDIRQDALAFRFTPNELRLFENNGIETLWQLDLPLSANDFDYSEILDVLIVLYYDGFYDPTLETNVVAALPTSGSASRAFSLQLSAPDELFFLKNQGEAQLVFEPLMFPRNQKALTRTTTTLKLTGTPATVQNLTLRLASDALGGELVLTTDANGEVLDTGAGVPLATLHGKPMFDRWTLRVTADDNPALVHNGTLDLSGLGDALVFSEYMFDYR